MHIDHLFFSFYWGFLKMRLRNWPDTVREHRETWNQKMPESWSTPRCCGTCGKRWVSSFFFWTYLSALEAPSMECWAFMELTLLPASSENSVNWSSFPALVCRPQRQSTLLTSSPPIPRPPPPGLPGCSPTEFFKLGSYSLYYWDNWGSELKVLLLKTEKMVFAVSLWSLPCHPNLPSRLQWQYSICFPSCHQLLNLMDWTSLCFV